jgi:PAS domain S-box-containing protein
MQDLRWILEALPVGVWVGTVPDGRVAYANPEFRRISGMDVIAESIIGDAPTTYGVFDRQGRPYPAERLPFSRVVATGEATMVEDMVMSRRDGRKVNLRAFGHPVFDAGSSLTHVVIAFVDITKEVKAEVEREVTEAPVLQRQPRPDCDLVCGSRRRYQGVEGAGLAALGVKSGRSSA